MTDPDIERVVRESRAAQGLPERVEDQRALDAIAALLAPVVTKRRSGGKRAAA